MATEFQQTLDYIHEKAQNTKELGDYFERMSKIYFENDDVQKQYYSEVQHYVDWAETRPEFSKVDIGIDLVAKLRDEEGYVAIQCKCYSEDNTITKEQINSFISASTSDVFKRLILIDTTLKDLGKHAQSTIENLNKPFIRIQINELETSRIDWLHYLSDNAVRFKKKNTLRVNL